jgi:hypothetical protein
MERTPVHYLLVATCINDGNSALPTSFIANHPGVRRLPLTISKESKALALNNFNGSFAGALSIFSFDGEYCDNVALKSLMELLRNVGLTVRLQTASWQPKISFGGPSSTFLAPHSDFSTSLAL